MNLLIIDDNPQDIEIFCEAAKINSPLAHCTAARGASEALHILRKATVLPDYIFIDINMPMVSGIECLKEIKRDPKLNSIHTVMYSSGFSTSDMEEIKVFGVECLEKPVDFDVFVHVLGSIFKKKVLRTIL